MTFEAAVFFTILGSTLLTVLEVGLFFKVVLISFFLGAGATSAFLAGAFYYTVLAGVAGATFLVSTALVETGATTFTSLLLDLSAGTTAKVFLTSTFSYLPLALVSLFFSGVAYLLDGASTFLISGFLTYLVEGTLAATFLGVSTFAVGALALIGVIGTALSLIGVTGALIGVTGGLGLTSLARVAALLEERGGASCFNGVTYLFLTSATFGATAFLSVLF